MKIFCTVQTMNYNIQLGNPKAVKSELAIGKTPHKSKPEPYILHFTDANKVGTRYSLINNILNIFCKFVNEGKTTIRFKTPPHDLAIKADNVQLKCFLKTLQMVLKGEQPLTEIKLVNLSSTLSKRPSTKMTIKSRGEIPVKGFPRTLEHLSISDVKLHQFPIHILQLRRLKVLNLSNNCISILPPALGNLPDLQELYLSNNRLYQSRLDQWEWINGTTINKSLKLLDLSNNNLKVLPYHIFKLQELVTFKLTDNQLVMLHDGIGRMRHLKYLHLNANFLLSIPFSITLLKLDLIDISENYAISEPPTSNLDEKKEMSLFEIAARSVFKNRLYYTPATLPRTICNYLDRASLCHCSIFIVEKFGSVLVKKRADRLFRHCVQTGLHKEVNVRYDVCSLKCYKIAPWK